MRLVEETHPILLQKCDPFNFDEPIMDPYELSDELHKIRKDGAGVGFSGTSSRAKYSSISYWYGRF